MLVVVVGRDRGVGVVNAGNKQECPCREFYMESAAATAATATPATEAVRAPAADLPSAEGLAEG